MKNFIIIAVIILTTFLALISYSKASNITIGATVQTTIICSDNGCISNAGEVERVVEGNLVTYYIKL